MSAEQTAQPLTLTAIAERLGVTLAAASQWRTRYAGTDRAFPAPDSPDGIPPYWFAERWPKIEAWHRAHLARTRGVRNSNAEPGTVDRATVERGDYVTQDDIGQILGRTGAWVRQVRRPEDEQGPRVPTLVPFPEPDCVVRWRTRGIALWRRERLESGEFEDWFRAHVQALADAEIAAMEANARRVRNAQA